MVDYEKGTASWDIGMMITRHHDECARRMSLRQTAMSGYSAEGRLAKALAVFCTCKMGDSPAEMTSLRRKVAHG